MDRSITARQIIFLFCLALISEICFFSTSSFAQEKKEEGSERGFSVLTFGYINFLDKDFRYIQVYPLRGTKKIKTFYIDKSTVIYKKKLRAKRDLVKPNTDIAIRAIEYDNISVAEAIFIIDQDDIDADEFDVELRKYR